MGPEAQRSLPVYQQIAEHIRDQILRGELKDGDPISSLSQIQRDWGKVSQGTARRALGILRADGLVVTRPGQPTVVTAPRTVDAPAVVAEALGVDVGTSVRMHVTDASVVFSRTS